MKWSYSLHLEHCILSLFVLTLDPDLDLPLLVLLFSIIVITCGKWSFSRPVPASIITFISVIVSILFSTILSVKAPHVSSKISSPVILFISRPTSISPILSSVTIIWPIPVLIGLLIVIPVLTSVSILINLWFELSTCFHYLICLSSPPIYLYYLLALLLCQKKPFCYGQSLILMNGVDKDCLVSCLSNFSLVSILLAVSTACLRSSIGNSIPV